MMLTTKELAERWGVAVGTLENHRGQKKGVPYVKIGASPNSDVRYRLKDILAYEKKNLIRSGS